MTGPLYDALYHRLEKVRWNMSDIPFDTVDKDAVSEETIEFVRVNCLMELSSLYATRMFLRDFQGNVDFCQFMSVWYFEEMRHYLILREYLKVFDAEPDFESLEDLDTDLKPSPWPNTLAMHWCGELRLGRWYLQWSKAAPERVLKQIYKYIADDEFRHAQAYEDFMERALQKDPSLMLPFANTSKWMLMNPQGDKHPTTHAEGSADGQSVTDRIDGYDDLQQWIQQSVPEEVERSLETRVLKTLSRLSGTEMKSRSDLVRLTLRLQAEAPSTPAPSSPPA
ncbi:MAG: ferritin-like domain-containing protein [Planctomycetota bacterium]|jgi:rubrerythrin|nr:ferritin-like domain-containing protein [Planctomycetota bacterium]